MNTKDKIFYTYGYMSKQGNIYYIGKGKGGRFYEKKHGRVQIPTDRSRIVFFRKDSLRMYAEPQLMLEREALDREIELIKHYGRKDLNEGHLLNLTDGGEGVSGMKHTEETKKKISESGKGEKNPMFGISLIPWNKGKTGIYSPEVLKKISEASTGRIKSKETREKIRKAHLGTKRTEETKKKMSIASSGENNGMYGMTGEKNPMFGKTHTPKTRKFLSLINSGKNNARYGVKHTEESLAKMRASLAKRKKDTYLSGKNHAMYKGRIVGTHKITGEVIRFEGGWELKTAGFHAGEVSLSIHGKNNGHKGYIWTREEIK